MDANRKFFINLIYKSLKNSSLRGLVIALCVLIGACVCAAFVNVYLDIQNKVSRELKTYGANMVFLPSNEGLISSQDLAKTKAKIPQNMLLGFGEYIFAQANIGVTDAIVMGVNFSQLKTLKPFLELRDGALISFELDDKNALIGIDLAKQTGFKVGDVIELRAAGENSATKVKIKGIVASGDKEDGLVILSLNLAQKLAKQTGFSHYAEAVLVGEFEQINDLASQLSTSNLNAKPVAKISKSQGLILDKIKLLMALICLVILLIASMCVNTTLSAIMLTRSKEIALLKAIGAGEKNIIKLFGGEILFLVFCCALLGAFLGYGLAQILGFVIFDSAIDFRVLSIPVAMGVSLIFAAFAAFLPIKRALGANISEILKGE